MSNRARHHGDARKRPQARRPSRLRRWLRRAALLSLALLLLPVLLVGLLRFVDPPTSAFMLAYRLESGQAVDHRWRPLDEIAPALAIAVVAAEDQRFPQHSGFDVEAIRSALEEARDGGRVRGASTLSQQVAKNLFLWETSSWPRKAVEAGLTVLIEALWSKRRILEMHLNLAEFGVGVYGAEAAAQRYFNKPAAALTAVEAARLAVVLPAPKRYSATRPGAQLQRRAAWVQRQVRQLGGPAYLHECCGLD
ncbi:monofunctional biosynthetic peptidoglycan transglycosylase [Aquimonas voraii]|uniref:Biosynthetic peptidoglycan transglycosylase n=1 Tax=Aquimonas voraii TaxID=265719 RepID=A0A1G6W2Q6_9GAMM|nr:monofunctional biosynthetic peptidoglycan transglycosylase [Aquimonas voraii]SDD60089.1 monofunctional biosynthetic peptidoglycan transglycosylase [Aquimonas voraii]